jgi:hypothetical protein
MQNHTGFVRGGDAIGGGMWSGEGRAWSRGWTGGGQVKCDRFGIIWWVIFFKGIHAVSGFQKLVMWLIQTLAIWDQFGLDTNLDTYEYLKESPWMKVLEVPNSPWIQGFRSDGPCEASNTIYWLETLCFGVTTHSYEFASPLATISKGKGSSTLVIWSKEEEGQGATALHGPPLSKVAATLPPWEGTSPSSYTTPLHLP